MIIGIDASRANKSNKTGVEWYSYHLIQALKKIDQENRYFLYTNSVLTGELARCPSNFHQALLKWPPVRLWTLIRLSWAMKFGRHKPHVLFVPAHTIPLLRPVKTAVTVHDIGFVRFPELYKWTDKIYHKWSTRYIKKHADQIITISNFSKQELQEVYQIPAEKIKVIHIGYNQQVYRQIDNQDLAEQVKSKYQIHQTYFMFTGRLEAKKNIGGLIESFSQYKEKHADDQHLLVLVGKPGYGFEAAKALIEKYQLDGWVKCLDYIPQEDLAVLLNQADLFIFPSLYEGFGIPILEAMACGTPVVCSNTTALPEVAGDAAIKFNPEKIEAIVKAIETVIYSPEIKAALVAKGLEQCQKFSWEKCARETLEVLVEPS
jgi:glycosyltransferase involved in cell wall biosynthesis